MRASVRLLRFFFALSPAANLDFSFLPWLPQLLATSNLLASLVATRQDALRASSTISHNKGSTSPKLQKPKISDFKVTTNVESQSLSPEGHLRFRDGGECFAPLLGARGDPRISRKSISETFSRPARKPQVHQLC